MEGENTSQIVVENSVDSSKDKVLGIADLGYSKSRVDELTQQLEIKRKEFREYLDNYKPVKDKFGRSSNPFGAFGSGPLKRGTQDLENSLRYERYKRSDAQDLQEAQEELSKEEFAVNNSFSRNETVVNKVDQRIDFKNDVVFDDNTQEILEFTKKDIVGRVLVHTTSHMDSILKHKGLVTRAWVEKNDSEYRKRMLAGKDVKGREMPFSPMNVSDEDTIYFGNNHVESYGGEGVAFLAEDVLLDTGLVFQLGRYAQGNMEVVVSDGCIPGEDKIPERADEEEYGSSNLKLTLDKAVMFFPKEKYKARCKGLLIAGYSSDWIKKNTFSYRGALSDNDVNGAVMDEIEKRLEERDLLGKSEIKIIPNPSVKPWGAKLFQLGAA